MGGGNGKGLLGKVEVSLSSLMSLNHPGSLMILPHYLRIQLGNFFLRSGKVGLSLTVLTQNVFVAIMGVGSKVV